MHNVLYIVWKDENNLAVPIIDEQHHAIVATINSLYYFIQEGWGLSALSPTLSIIKSYSAFHFKTEEGMLHKLNYPELSKHIAAQKKFSRDADAVAQEAIAYKDPAIMLKFLKDWWIQHLETEHQEYSEYLAKLRD